MTMGKNMHVRSKYMKNFHKRKYFYEHRIEFQVFVLPIAHKTNKSRKRIKESLICNIKETSIIKE